MADVKMVVAIVVPRPIFSPASKKTPISTAGIPKNNISSINFMVVIYPVFSDITMWFGKIT